MADHRYRLNFYATTKVKPSLAPFAGSSSLLKLCPFDDILQGRVDHNHSVAVSLTTGKQRGIGAFVSHGSIVRNAVLQHIRLVNPLLRSSMLSLHESTSAARMEEQGFESTKISDILKSKGKTADGSWLWCTTEDSVYDAVNSMTQHNVGALVVVKLGEEKSVAGIITERDYLRKIIVQGRSSKSTKVGDIMTEEDKLITVTPYTKVLQAMQLMTRID